MFPPVLVTHHVTFVRHSEFVACYVRHLQVQEVLDKYFQSHQPGVYLIYISFFCHLKMVQVRDVYYWIIMFRDMHEMNICI